MFFGYFTRKLRYLTNSKRARRENGDIAAREGAGDTVKINEKLQDNLQSMRDTLGDA